MQLAMWQMQKDLETRNNEVVHVSKMKILNRISELKSRTEGGESRIKINR